MDEREYLTPEETNKHRNILYIGLTVIIFILSALILIITFATTAEASGEIWSSGSVGNDDYGYISEIHWIPSINATLGSFDMIATKFSGSGSDTLQFELWIWSGGSFTTALDCKSAVDTVSNWGIPDYPSQTTLHVPDFTGTQCSVNTGTTYAFRTLVNGSPTPSLYVYGQGDYSSGTDVEDMYLQVNSGITNTNTRLEWVNPPKTNPSATTSTSTIAFEFNYYINSATSSPENLSHIILSLCPLSYPNDDCQKETITASTTWDSFQNVTQTITTNRMGFYLAIVSFWNGVEEVTDCSWWQVFCNEETPVLSFSVSNSFNVATTTIPTDLPLPYESISSMCSDSNFAGEAICKTLLWLFYPSEATLDRYLNIGQIMQNKIPFSFFYLVKNELENISNSQADEGSNIVVNPMGFEFTLIDWQGMHDTYTDLFVDTDVEKYLIYGLWITFAFYAFYKVESTIQA